MKLRGAIAGLICTAVVAAFSINNETYFGAEWLLRDFVSARLARHRPPDPRIVIVPISDSSARALSEFGRPQTYSRELYALAIEELKRAGAKVIAIDLLFSEENPQDPAGDRHMHDVVQGPVVLAAQTVGKTAIMPIFPARVGTIRLVSSPFSANIHSYPIADRVSNTAMPSLAVAAAQAMGKTIPLDARTMTIRWHATHEGPGLQYNAVDFHKVVLASMARNDPSAGISEEKLAQFDAQFKDKAVLIGLTSVGLDLRSTPLSPTSAGVEIHANALDNLINSQFDAVANRWLIFPLIAVAAAILGALLDRIRRQLIAALVAIAFVAAALAIIYGAAAAGDILPAFGSVASLALTYVTITVINFVSEQEQTAVLRTTFGRYVSPQILTHILAHPEKVQLGGERRDLTILFSDIRGFTSISEASEPEQVVEMLNEYLTRMVEILLAHGGTLDKFIGDAVMGVWNAPAADPDHPRHAVACAVEMIRETTRIRERWMTEGKAAIRIGIGINSGEAVVGNIGAEQVFGYTVIGDAVNLASRLEGKNKDYGTEIIISEFTRERIADAFETVYLDEVKVKGKEKAVKIYEVRS